jgi:hypothetical protein
VTGGVPSGSDFNQAFRQIVRDNSAYYVLGYDSTNPRQDGGYRRIQVEVRRRDLKVRARDGYFVEFPPEANPDPNRLFSWNGRAPAPRRIASRPLSTPDITSAMSSPVPLTAVPMKVVTSAFRTPTREASVSVVIEIPPHGLDLLLRDDALSGQVDVALGVTSGTRSLRGTEYSYPVEVRGEARDQVSRNGLRVTSELRLNPGEYTLHVAAGTRGGRFGKVLHQISVPDFSAALLTMSGLSLTSGPAAAIPTLRGRDARDISLPGPPSVSREYAREETLVVYAELYENVWWTDDEHALHLTAELRGDSGRALASRSETRSSRAAQVPGGGHGFAMPLPLADVPPGAYVLRVEGRADFGERRPVVREVAINVR